MTRPDQVGLIVVVLSAGALLGAAASDAGVDRTALAAAAVVMVPLAASVHLANEWADAGTDALTVRTRFSGGSGAMTDLGLDPALAGRAALAAAGLAVAGGALALAVGWFGVTAGVLLLAGLVGGWQYSVGPLRLSRRGLGEVTNALLGGLLLPVAGAAAATGTVTGPVVLACLPFALLDLLNLLATQWPDRAADAAVGKHTLVTRLAPSVVRRLGGVCLAGALVTGAAGPLLAGLWAPAVSAAAAAPFGLWSVGTLTRREDPLPAVAAMVVAVLALGGWSALALAGYVPA